MNCSFETPILFLIFNRPDTTVRIFEEIRKRKPKYLFVAADGARTTKTGEAELCLQTRDIIKQVDWDCDVKTLFREQNLGCGKAVSSAITWFFENVEQGIILEDDCLPHPDFFNYCEELLNKYKENEQVMLISGDNFQNGTKRGEASYYFSAYPHIWGWATWQRSWNKYDFTLENYSSKEFKVILKEYFRLWTEQQFWLNKFLLIKKQAINTWDYQFTFTIWENKGLAILPNVNLVSNIGFTDNSTHTNDPNHKLANIPTFNILPLLHPTIIERNRVADEYYYKVYNYKTTLKIFYRIICRYFL
ncbi:MAG: nucleotide-diphospho-sugar transferase [Bacteroidia bacterium]